MLPKKPKLRDEYPFQSSASRKQDLLEYYHALSHYERARAELAIEGLRDCIGSINCNEICDEALSEIYLSEEE